MRSFFSSVTLQDKVQDTETRQQMCPKARPSTKHQSDSDRLLHKEKDWAGQRNDSWINHPGVLFLSAVQAGTNDSRLHAVCTLGLYY